MKITKELLENLKLKTISLKNEKKNILCFLERIEKEILTFSLPQKIEYESNIIMFEAVFESSVYQTKYEAYEFTATLQDYGEDWLNVEVHQENYSGKISDFLNTISEMEKKYETYGRRKENRVKIGKEKSIDFGLSALEQSIFIQSSKFLQPCVVLDASVHGICVITIETPQIKKEETFCIKLSFVTPEQTVILKAHKVYSRITKTDNKTFVTLSCQLLEPIHFAWKERVINMIDKADILR